MSMFCTSSEGTNGIKAWCYKQGTEFSKHWETDMLVLVLKNVLGDNIKKYKKHQPYLLNN